MAKNSYVRWFEEIGIRDVPSVGGKNASLGEMITALKSAGIRVPEGFATTADAYWEFLESNQLRETIQDELKQLKGDEASLEKVGKAVRDAILHAEFSKEFVTAVSKAYQELSKRYGKRNADVAVRSSATAEDLPDASFAGQQETFLNITGIGQVLDACRKCYASLFTNRAITYRIAKGFDHMQVALSIGIQKMVRADKAGSGVLFTIDTETGFKDVVVINAGWGLGENVVQGSISPDEYVVFKPLLNRKGFVPIIEKYRGDKERKLIYAKKDHTFTKNTKTTPKEREAFVLSDEEILLLARWGAEIERHYGKAMDVEWAKDGNTGEMFIVQARPETVHSTKKQAALKTYVLKKKGKVLVEGLSVGEAIVAAKAQVIKNIKDIDQFEEGSILVTGMTSPDWVPIMQKSSGIITDRGGRTSHAAIVSRELGVPAIVGTIRGTTAIKDGALITLSCAEGDHGFVYEGKVEFEENALNLDNMPQIKTQIMMNIASPEGALRWWRLPCHGIGLARMEFIINNHIKIHPMALVRFDQLKDKRIKKKIQKLTRGYKDKSAYFVDRLAQGIGKIAASRYPGPVIVRLSDFKTNEYANLIGGKQFEPKEENPMLGWRGASRYYSPHYIEGFALECKALKRVRDEMGLTNVIVMIPFCRTLEEADKVLDVMKRFGLERHKNGLEVYVMAEIPSNVILAEEFADRFDGFSIGSNDLTQLVLGVDRDSEDLAPLFNERNEAVKRMIRDLIHTARRKKCKVGICGQAPSDHPDFAEFLVECGIDSISLNPDSIVGVIQRLAKLEKEASKSNKIAG